MPKGGVRPRKEDGSLDHLIKPKWKSGKTRTIRVPEVLADRLLQIGRMLDDGKDIVVSQDKKAKGKAASSVLSQDNKVDSKQMKASLAQTRMLLQNATTPKSKGGSYAANNATGMRKLVEQALVLLNKVEIN